MITNPDQLGAVTHKTTMAARYQQLNERAAILAVACGTPQPDAKSASGLPTEQDLRRTKVPIAKLAHDVDVLATELEIDALSGTIGVVGTNFDALSIEGQAEVRAALLAACRAARTTAAYLLIHEDVNKLSSKMERTQPRLGVLRSKLDQCRRDFILGQKRIDDLLTKITEPTTPNFEKRKLLAHASTTLQRYEVKGQKVIQLTADIVAELDRVHFDYASLASLHAHAIPEFRRSRAMRLPASTLSAKLKHGAKRNPYRYPFQVEAERVVEEVDEIAETKARCEELVVAVRQLLRDTRIYSTEVIQRSPQLDATTRKLN
ncbi:hypothetical protein [Mycobacteroides abscessus]|uniref:hypothetical protein n=1 Tax=Mycobacteroides abscessus TaxID=36809 RepID=UPI0006975B3B|nr:hypothetical protein [Mycobacteroides abscessus]MDO3067112.1 hypothetical protein [Mycobacteroides abscessus subsp. bolletii]